MAIRTNREILTGGKKYHQKQAKKYGVDEVVFDKAAREEFLTGFHKRKVERQKKAQAYHKEQERKARIEEKKQLRREEQTKFEEQLKQLRELREALDLGGTEEDATPNGNAEESDEEWTGFGDDADEAGEAEEGKEVESEDEPVRGILLRKQVYKLEDKDILGDAIADKETEVTIESLDNPYTAAITGRSVEALAKANNVDLDKSDEVLEGSIKRAKDYAKLCGVEKPKQKKKKFRYLSKAERRENNRKQKLSKLKSRQYSVLK